MSARMKLTVEQVAALEHHLRNHPFAGAPASRTTSTGRFTS